MRACLLVLTLMFFGCSGTEPQEVEEAQGGPTTLAPDNEFNSGDFVPYDEADSTDTDDDSNE